MDISYVFILKILAVTLNFPTDSKLRDAPYSNTEMRRNSKVRRVNLSRD